MKIPPRALNAANRILARIPSTHWTPQERDVAAGIIANETGQERAIEACKLLLASARLRDAGRDCDSREKTAEAERMAELALRR